MTFPAAMGGLELPARREIEALRPHRYEVSPWSVPHFSIEQEPDGLGGVALCTTVFLIGTECTFRCSMCDLWKHTTIAPTPIGAIPHQLREALRTANEQERSKANPKRWLKLYNASNFFDPRAVPAHDHTAIATLCRGYEKVIVENHPKLCDERMRSFAAKIEGKLEIAMGLETVHPSAMRVLNKSMTLEDFSSAVLLCSEIGISVRTFVLLQPPGMDRSESVDWTWRAIQFAFENGVRHVSLIPVRSGNGWVDQQIALGQYALPDMGLVNEFFSSFDSPPAQRALSTRNVRDGRALAIDLWDWDTIPGGTRENRLQLYERIERFNLTQQHVDGRARDGIEFVAN